MPADSAQDRSTRPSAAERIRSTTAANMAPTTTDSEGVDPSSAFPGADTASLMSSIAKHREENGRLYHTYGSTEHWGPNDEKALDQQDLSHHLFTLALNQRLFLAPVTPSAVLDLGCGTGIWAIDVAEQFPKAKIYGTDLSPVQPSWVPENCFFEVDDYNLDWLDEKRYDLIHARELLGTVPDWTAFYRKAFQALKPGGWYEQHDPGLFWTSDAGPLDKEHVFNQWADLLEEAGIKAHASFDVGPYIKGWMEEAGFVNVTEYRMKLFIGGWSKDKREKELGQWNQLRLEMGVADFCSRRFHNQMGLTPQEIQIFCAQVRKAFRDKGLKGQQWAYFVYGQRPEASGSSS